MPVAHAKRMRELQAVKMKSDIKDEVCYVQELLYIQEMRKSLVHQLPQIFAATEPRVLSDVKPVIKVEPTDPVKKEPEPVSENIMGREELKSTYVTPDLKTETLHFFVALATYLLGLGTIFLGIFFLWDLSVFEESGLATEFFGLVIGRLYMGTGLAMLILVYQKHLRALGTLLLCEAVAEVVMMVLVRNSGFETDVLIGAPMTGVKGVLGLWLVNSRE